MQKEQTITYREYQKERTLDAVVEETARSYILEVLERKSGNVAATASALGLSRQGLYKKMKRLGIDWQD